MMNGSPTDCGCMEEHAAKRQAIDAYHLIVLLLSHRSHKKHEHCLRHSKSTSLNKSSPPPLHSSLLIRVSISRLSDDNHYIPNSRRNNLACVNWFPNVKCELCEVEARGSWKLCFAPVLTTSTACEEGGQQTLS